MIGNQDPVRKTKEVTKQGPNTVETYESGDVFSPDEAGAGNAGITAGQANPERIDSSTWSDQDREYSKTGGTKRNPFRP